MAVHSSALNFTALWVFGFQVELVLTPACWLTHDVWPPPVPVTLLGVSSLPPVRCSLCLQVGEGRRNSLEHSLFEPCTLLASSAWVRKGRDHRVSPLWPPLPGWTPGREPLPSPGPTSFFYRREIPCLIVDLNDLSKMFSFICGRITG